MKKSSDFQTRLSPPELLSLKAAAQYVIYFFMNIHTGFAFQYKIAINKLSGLHKTLKTIKNFKSMGE